MTAPITPKIGIQNQEAIKKTINEILSVKRYPFKSLTTKNRIPKIKDIPLKKSPNNCQTNNSLT